MRRLLSFLALGLLAACASGPEWVNPAVPKSQWSKDLAACRHQADDAVGVTDYYEPDDRSSDPTRMLNREDTRRRFDTYVSSCMKGNGYRPAK